MAAHEFGREMPTNNQVAEDQIWRTHCIAEERSKKAFQSKWGFLQGPLSKFVEDELDKLVDPNRPDWRTMVQKPVEDPVPLSKYIYVQPSPQPLPKTTAGMIGWRAADPKNWPDRYGRHQPGRVDIVKQLNWPRDVPM
ncbi:hypothetical protein CSKR_104802 [Clonorchis sinensis]|uniref:Uncharacterized protein n=1 Tax=Clonorchis sinensis TaxID=79923 RepID=A0A419PXN1_CLOSI|nr:hypothetical protein CSKR_104802 [Clonorchis sinensis]